VGTVFGIKFLLANDELHGICRDDPAMCPSGMVTEYGNLKTTAENDRAYELVGFGAGTAAIVTATYLWWRSAARQAGHAGERGAYFLQPSLSPGGWALSLAGRL